MANWDKARERSVVRAVDVLCGVLSGAAVEAAPCIIASRALLVIEQQVFPLHEDLVLAENVDAAARKATSEEWSDDAAVRQWLTEVLSEHAFEYSVLLHEVYEDDWEHVDRSDHPVWALLELSPLSRRLRLWQDAAARSGAGLGRDIGVGAHQLGHWAAGRSRPGEDERRALATALGVHPGWLDASRDELPDVELYRFRVCPCEEPATTTRGGLGRDEPGWYESVAVQDAAVHWCDACGQAWLKDSRRWLLPLPPGDERTPRHGVLADGQHPAVYVRHRSLDEPWPSVLWRPPWRPVGKKSKTRTVFQVPDLLREAPKPLSERLARPVPQMPQPIWFAAPEQRLTSNAAWCRTCRNLLDAPLTAAGGPWVLLHRSTRQGELSTWAYPSEQDALHAAAHLVMSDLSQADAVDPVALDLFADQAFAQVVARYLELHPETDLFKVDQVVPMRANEF